MLHKIWTYYRITFQKSDIIFVMLVLKEVMKFKLVLLDNDRKIETIMGWLSMRIFYGFIRLYPIEDMKLDTSSCSCTSCNIWLSVPRNFKTFFGLVEFYTIRKLLEGGGVFVWFKARKENYVNLLRIYMASSNW